MPSGQARTYVTSSTGRVDPFSVAVVLPLADAQEVVQWFHDRSLEPLRPKPANSKHHFVLEARVTELDMDPPSGQAPLLSVAAPPEDADPDTRYVVVWLTVMTFRDKVSRKQAPRYFQALQADLTGLCADRGWTLRPEWSKTWCYSKRAAFAAHHEVIRSFLEGGWPAGDGTALAQTKVQLDALDPLGVFRSRFHGRIGL